MSTFERVVKVFNAVFEDEVNPETVKPEANLKEDIGVNSIGMLYTALALEEEFGVKFANEDFTRIVTVQDVISCIEQKLGA